MIMIQRSMRKMTKIGKKLMVAIVAFSSLVTFVITAIQLGLEYQQQRADVDELLERLSIYYPNLAASVWSFNEEQIQLALDSLVRLPNISSAQVSAEGGRTWSAHSDMPRHFFVRTYPLEHVVRGTTKQIARIEITADLDPITGRLITQALTILISNAIKTFLVAGFMFALFRHLVTNRIDDLAKKVNGLVPQLAPSAFSFANPEDEFPARGDEIDGVRWAFDGMAQRLKLVIADLNARHLQLESENRQRQEAENSLRQAMEQLSQTLVELERFAYVAAHDLQEPIRSIVSFSQMLERRCAASLGEDGKEYLAFIIGESHRLSRLVTDLLEYSRCESQNLNLTPVDCTAAVTEALNTLHAAIEQKQAQITLAPLPTLTADAVQLHQLFVNLLGNALKYCAPDVVPHIHVSAERGEGAWRITVADNGIGIEPQYHAYIFEVFRRLHTRDAYPGTGIGLALCKRVAENHGGTLSVRSAPGQGSAFTLTLPDQPANVLAAPT